MEDKACPYNPAYLWRHTCIYVERRLKAGGDALVEAEKLIDGTVKWAEWVVSERREDAGQWFNGDNWGKLLDYWISLGKKVRRETYIMGRSGRRAWNRGADR
jgi:hypothetical protein